MSTIKEILAKQAAAVKENSNKLQQAEQLERLAAQLRAEANKPVRVDFKAIARQKESRLDKFSSAMQAGVVKQAEDVLKANGWLRSMFNKEKNETTYGRKDKPGHKIIVTGGTFSAYYHEEVKLTGGKVAFLADYLTSNQ